MAWTTGSLSGGPSSLLVALSTFLYSTGWTLNVNAAVDNSTLESGWLDIDGTGKRSHFQKTAADGTVMYFNVRAVVRGIIFSDYYTSSAGKINGDGADRYYSEVTGLGINGSTGYSSDSAYAWDNQPGFPDTSGSGIETLGGVMTGMSSTSIPNYWFFDEDDVVSIVVEYTSGKYTHMSFGNLTKLGTWTGGQFYSATVGSRVPTQRWYERSVGGKFEVDTFTHFTAWSHSSSQFSGSAVYVDSVDSFTGWLHNGSQGLLGDDKTGYMSWSAPNYKLEKIGTEYGTNRHAICGSLYVCSPNEINAIMPLIPIYCSVYRLAYDKWSIAGHVGSVRGCNIQHYNPADEVIIGPDTWIVFPYHCKDDFQDGLVEDSYSANMGFAYKKNP